MTRILSLICLLCGLAQAQQPVNYRTYFYRHVTTGANETLTVQKPPANAREVVFKGAVVKSPDACTVRLEMMGTPATATLATPKRLNRKAGAGTARIYTASNVGAGDVIYDYDAEEGVPLGIGESGLALAGGGSAQENFSLRTTCPIGTEILVIYSEPL